VVDASVASIEFLPFLGDELGLNPAVLTYTAAISLAAAVVFGLAPAFVASRVSPGETLKDSTQAATTGRSHGRLRNGLVVGQLALGLPMVICCGLAIRHVRALQSPDVLGIEAENLLTLRVDLPEYRYEDEASRVAFYRQLLEKVRGLPGVESAGAMSSLPIGTGWTLGGAITIEGRQEVEEGFHGYRVVSPGLFEAMGVRLLSGRLFTDRDAADGPLVAVLNQRAALRYWPDGDAVGRRILLDRSSSREPRQAQWLTIVGVVADFGCTVLGKAFPPALYLPYGQSPRPAMDLAVRTRADSMTLIGSLREAVHEMDPGIPVYDFSTVEERVHRWLRDDRWLSYVLAGLAALVIGLVSIGLYGIMSYAVARRTNELGIRIALGADRRDILSLVSRASLVLASKGILVGLGLSIPIGMVMASSLYGVGGLDPLTYVGVILLLMVVALASGFVPALRATRIDPMAALRHE
jgi:predicted permease